MREATQVTELASRDAEGGTKRHHSVSTLSIPANRATLPRWCFHGNAALVSSVDVTAVKRQFTRNTDALNTQKI